MSLPAHVAWFEGREVVYVTTDASDADAARSEGANYAPRLAAALSAPASQGVIERVYAVSNFAQRTVFPSVPVATGVTGDDKSYSPLWRKIVVTWRSGAVARELESEEEILAAQESGLVSLSVTNVVLNCPILSVGGSVLVRGAVPTGLRGR